MRYPDCEGYIEIEDWTNDEPFNCPHCNEVLQLVTDEGGYCGANDKRLVVFE